MLGFISLAISVGFALPLFSFPVGVERPVRGCVLGGAERERLKREFMSAEFVLEVIGALLQLWLISFSVFSVHCMLLLCLQQRANLVFPSISMRLRLRRYEVSFLPSFRCLVFFFFLFLAKDLKWVCGVLCGFCRTWSGVKCFGGFHIKRFFYLFLFLRGAHT